MNDSNTSLIWLSTSRARRITRHCWRHYPAWRRPPGGYREPGLVASVRAGGRTMPRCLRKKMRPMMTQTAMMVPSTVAAIAPPLIPSPEFTSAGNQTIFNAKATYIYTNSNIIVIISCSFKVSGTKTSAGKSYQSQCKDTFITLLQTYIPLHSILQLR